MKRRIFCKILILALLVSSHTVFIPDESALGWDGYDYDSGSFVEIESGNLVRSGNDIEVYDYGDGSYHDVSVESINDYGGSVDLEVYDYSTGEYRTFDMGC